MMENIPKEMELPINPVGSEEAFDWSGTSADKGTPNIETLMGELIRISSYSVHKGSYGDYSIIRGVKLSTGEEVVFQTGGVRIMEKLHYLRDNSLLPVVVRIGRNGRVWDFVK